MRTYLRFSKLPRVKGKKTCLYRVEHVDKNITALGIIRWHGAWRQYVLDMLPDTFWSAGCLEEVAQYLKMLNEKQRKTWKQKR